MTHTYRSRLWCSALALLVMASPVMAQSSLRAPANPVATHAVAPRDTAPERLHPYRPGIDVVHYDFAITLPMSGRAIEARTTAALLRRMSVDTAVFDLNGLTVDSVMVRGAIRRHVRDSNSIRVPLLPSDGPAVSVSIVYHGEPADGLIIRETPERGWSAFGDNWPNRARFWLPTVDHPSDKATVTWTVVAPAVRAIVANGLQTSRVVLGGGQVRTRYEQRQSIPSYLMVIAAARMVSTTLGRTACGSGEGRSCVPQAVWTFPESKSYVPGPFADAGRMVQFFARISGPFPYAQLNHLQSSTRFGGMENATAIFYSDDAFKRRAVGSQLIAHETAHQWFGNAVTPRQWQDLWLSEGFASYWAPLYLREISGDSAFHQRMREIRDEIMAAPVVATRPVVDSAGALAPMTLLNANSYQKGAWVLHMLRKDVGDSAFFQGARAYQRSERHGTATTDDLRLAMEKSSGSSLVVFFHQWLHRPGWAELDVQWQWNANTRALSMQVTQGSKFPPFGVPLVLAVRDSSGREERHTLHIDPLRQQSMVQPILKIGTPTMVLADPDIELLARVTVSRGPSRN